MTDPIAAEESEQPVFFMCSGCRTPTPAAEIRATLLTLLDATQDGRAIFDP